ncbi:MAG: response regulator transcription factor [Sporichthyaceae bacterium]
MSERSARTTKDSAPGPFPLPTTSAGWRAAGHELDRALSALAERAAQTVGHDVDLGGVDPAAALGHLVLACLEELRDDSVGAPRRVAVASLLADSERLAGALSERTMVSRARQLAECERGLARLREITTTAGLIDGVCDELIRSLGFKRTMLARVEAGMWRPWKGNASMLGEGWVSEWIERAIPLDDLTLETRLLHERRPALVLDTNVAGIARIVHQAGVRSYVAAPIMPGGQVVGFFHADHGPDGRTCDETDRDILWTFAEGFGHLYERTTLLEQVATRTEAVRATVAGLTRAMDELAEAELTLVHEASPGDERVVVRQGLSTRLGQFTARELEVLELIVAGARNNEIAQRLAITVGTVKSHVKSILAKLGVLNRSQAIAMYLGAPGPDPDSDRPPVLDALERRG